MKNKNSISFITIITLVSLLVAAELFLFLLHFLYGEPRFKDAIAYFYSADGGYFPHVNTAYTIISIIISKLYAT